MRVETAICYGRGGARGCCLVFLELPEKRPIEQGNIMGDFIWRRQVDFKDYARDPKIKDFVVRYLNERYNMNLVAEDMQLSFSRKAGCRSCPCSPGLVLKYKERYMNRADPRALYLHVGDYVPRTKKKVRV